MPRGCPRVAAPAWHAGDSAFFRFVTQPSLGSTRQGPDLPAPRTTPAPALAPCPSRGAGPRPATWNVSPFRELHSVESVPRHFVIYGKTQSPLGALGSGTRELRRGPLNQERLGCAPESPPCPSSSPSARTSTCNLRRVAGVTIATGERERDPLSNEPSGLSFISRCIGSTSIQYYF